MLPVYAKVSEQPPSFYEKIKKKKFSLHSLSETAKVDKVTYIENTHHVLEKDGLFMITSCNWTEQELVTMFSTHFKHLETIPTPSFTFGGKKGNSVTTVVFNKIDL